MNKLKEKMTLNPIMTFIILILGTIILSGFLNVIGFEATYYKINPNSNEYEAVLATVESLFSLSGIKYIFSSTVSNFVSFTPLSMLIIILIGIGIMEKSGFLKSLFTLLTRSMKKTSITFAIVFIAVISSLFGDLSYVILIPISALLFLHGRRNPIIGIVATYAGLCCGTGLSIFFTSVDSSMLTQTLNSAKILDSTINFGTFAFIGIMTISSIIVSIVITLITEKIIVDKVEKYEFKEERKEFKLGKKEYRGLLFAAFGGIIYLFIFIYNIIPGAPLGGNLLDYSQKFYIDKLFSFDSFFSEGFVFIVTIFFIILGLFYGIGARTIKNNNDFCEDLAHSLDGIGRTLILILLASVLINVFKKTNIGTVIVAIFADMLNNTSFSGVPLIILLFVIGAISNIFVNSSSGKWLILSVTAVPTFMNNSLSPEFAQVIMRFSEGLTTGLTPLLAYFVIYLAYIEKYNQNSRPISLFTTLKYQIPYSVATGVVLLIIVIIWYVTGIPLGIGSIPTL